MCRSILLTVVPKGNAKMSKHRYEVKQLPGEILTDEKKTYFKVICEFKKFLCASMFKDKIANIHS